MERGSIYPSWRYHKTEPPVLCENAEQDAALGSNWSDKDIREISPNEPLSTENSVENLDLSEKTDLVPTSDAVGPKKRGRKSKA
jgi:hypothetical protein